MKRLVAVLAAALLLSGCAAGSAPEATPSPTPTPEYATENQVASVVAQYEADWREVMDEAGECRAKWVFDPGSLPGMSCWLREQTMSTTAEIVVRDLSELEIPPSMTDLTADLTTVLQAIVDEQVKANCGAEAAPADTEACTSALGGLNWQYTTLETQLDGWRPYL